MKKILTLCLTVLTLAACLSGCGGAKAISGKDFCAIMEENGYIPGDRLESVLDMYCDESYCYFKDEKEIFYAYFRFSKEETAVKMLPKFHEFIKLHVDPNSASFPEMKTLPNQDYFTQKIAWGMAYLTRINNVVVFTGAPHDNVEECERIFREMGLLYEED